jgi:hypothetical protein
LEVYAPVSGGYEPQQSMNLRFTEAAIPSNRVTINNLVEDFLLVDTKFRELCGYLNNAPEYQLNRLKSRSGLSGTININKAFETNIQPTFNFDRIPVWADNFSQGNSIRLTMVTPPCFSHLGTAYSSLQCNLYNREVIFRTIESIFRELIHDIRILISNTQRPFMTFNLSPEGARTLYTNTVGLPDSIRSLPVTYDHAAWLKLYFSAPQDPH